MSHTSGRHEPHTPVTPLCRSAPRDHKHVTSPRLIHCSVHLPALSSYSRQLSCHPDLAVVARCRGTVHRWKSSASPVSDRAVRPSTSVIHAEPLSPIGLCQHGQVYESVACSTRRHLQHTIFQQPRARCCLIARHAVKAAHTSTTTNHVDRPSALLSFRTLSSVGEDPCLC